VCFLVSKEQNGGFTTTNSGLSVEIYNYNYLYIYVQMASSGFSRI
jgi:hypothetical protein